MSTEVADRSIFLDKVVASGEPFQACVNELLDFCQQQCPDGVWGEIRALDYARDVAGLTRWLQNLLTSEPPGIYIEALWFGLYTVLRAGGQRELIFYLAGADEFDVQDPNWARFPAYWPAGRRAHSPALQEMRALLEKASPHACALGEYVLYLGYACLAVAEACRSIDHRLLLGERKRRHVAVGFDGGDYILLGDVDEAGWHLMSTAGEQVELEVELLSAEGMGGYARQAVDLAREKYRLELDFTEASLDQVEQILGDVYESQQPKDLIGKLRRKGPSQADLWRTAMIWGSYVGEVIRRRWGGEWVQEPAGGQDTAIALHTSGIDVYPLNRVYDRLANGPEENVWFYYRLLKHRLEATY